MRPFRFLIPILLLAALPLEAACINKYVVRADGNKRTFTLLTGMMNFQEAQELATAIAERKSPPVVWVDAGGKQIAQQLGQIKAVRPMPVACEGKSSGVVISLTVLSARQPQDNVLIQLKPDLIVEFEKQD
jgi:hypothetical protein